MKKSTFYFLFSQIVWVTALGLMFGQSLMGAGVALTIGWICLAASDILEALGQ